MALLLGALVLAVVCLIVPKVIGAVPLTILSGSMAPAMPAGALAVVRPVDGSTARVGDVLTYQVGAGEPTLVTHRVTAVTRSSGGDVTLTTQGDANDAPDGPVDPGQVQGQVVYAVPYFGWVANRLNVGTGAGYVEWLAYGLIAFGSLRVIRAIAEALRATSRP